MVQSLSNLNDHEFFWFGKKCESAPDKLQSAVNNFTVTYRSHVKVITVILEQKLFHQFTMRSVACNNLQCQERCTSDERGNIRPCRNTIMNDWPSYWQLKLVNFSFKTFMLTNGLRLFCFDNMYSKVIKATLRLKKPGISRPSVHLKRICNGVQKLWNATVRFNMSILYSTASKKKKKYMSVNSRKIRKYLLANSYFINVSQQIAKLEY
jgi:hypothetical protein